MKYPCSTSREETPAPLTAPIRMTGTMSELQEALGGALGIIVAGYVLLILAGSTSIQSTLNLTVWGALFIACGVLIAVTAVAAVVGAIIGEIQ